MRFLILNTDYDGFLKHLYAQHPGLSSKSYSEQLDIRMQSLFGVADFYSSNLNKLGHEAYDIHANNFSMQRAWANEHDHSIEVTENPASRSHWLARARYLAAKTPLRSLKHRFNKNKPTHRPKQPDWFYKILAAQIKYYAPDVILNQDMWSIDSEFLASVKQPKTFVIGQHAATQLPEDIDLSGYDLLISSFLPMLQFFQRKAAHIPAELHRLGFEETLLPALTETSEVYDLTFVGSFTEIHSSRTRLIEELCRQFPQLKIWSPSADVARNSLLKSHYVGEAWGMDMYRILKRSKITINHHGNVPDYANNLRLYEATGVGTMLITDWKTNLPELFDVDNEIRAYQTMEECIDLIGYYLQHADERESIAQAGQKRTLKDHTWLKRMQELVVIIDKYA